MVLLFWSPPFAKLSSYSALKSKAIFSIVLHTVLSLSIDEDRTVCKTIEKIALDFGGEYELSFANGGDQNNNTIPERLICDQMGITLVDGLGDKIQSSSWLLKK